MLLITIGKLAQTEEFSVVIAIGVWGIFVTALNF